MKRQLKFPAALALICVLLASPARGQQDSGTPPQSGTPAQSGTATQSGTPAQGGTPNQPATPGGDNRQMPVPPLKGVFGGSGDQESVPPNVPEPDTHAITGGEAVGIGDLQRERDVLDFSAHVGEMGDNGIVRGQVLSVTDLGGSFDFDRTWQRFHTQVAYNGALIAYLPNTIANQQAHTLGVSQDFEWSRWIVRLRDDLVVSPQATFSGLDTGGFGLAEVGLLSTILPGLTTNETILTGYAERLNEAALGEVDYRLSRRAELTFAGSYGILHFLNSGYIDSYEANGRVGYNYALDAKNTFGFLYDYSLVGYQGFGEKVDSNLAQVVFGRKVLGRLAFQVAAGPERIALSQPQSPLESEWTWSAYALLTYAQQRTKYSVTFSHGLVAGAGVLTGGQGDLVTGFVDRQLSRTWTLSGDAGYAYNSNLGTATTAAGANLFSYYYGNANLTHDLNRRLVITLSYGLQKQITTGVCPVANCGFPGLRQVGGVTLDWHSQKFQLR